jgi:hypothetical protein
LQRYTEANASVLLPFTGMSDSTTAAALVGSLARELRVAPAITFSNLTVNDTFASGPNVTGLVSIQSGKYASLYLSATVAGGLTGQRWVVLTTLANAFLQLDARL